MNFKQIRKIYINRERKRKLITADKDMLSFPSNSKSERDYEMKEQMLNWNVTVKEV